MSKIVQFTARNFKRLKAVSISPDGSIVTIAGKNGSGKSSILDAIEAVFRGGRALPPRPVREGEASAELVCDVDGLTIERRIKAGGGSSLTVTSDGGKQPLSKPQSVLDLLWSKFSFDPLEFANMTPGQREFVLAQVCGIDLEEHKARVANFRKRYSDASKELDRVRDSLVGRKAEWGNREDRRPKPVDISDLLAKRTKKHEIQEAIRDVESFIAENGKRKQALEFEIQKLEDSIAARRTQIMQLESNNEKFAKDLEEKRTLEKRIPSFEDIDSNLMRANEVNRLIEVYDKIHELTAAEGECEKDLETAKAQGVAEKARVSKAIRDAKLPVEGLEFSLADGLRLRGLPFDQASTSEKLRISVALAAAQAGELKVMLIREGNDLDADSLALLAKMAEEMGVQLWVERIEGGPGQVELVDGSPVVDGGQSE